MKLDINPKESYQKPLIEEGYYVGRIKDFKPFQDRDGKDIINQWGNKQMIISFDVYELEKKKETGERVISDRAMFEGTEVVLEYFVTSMIGVKKDDVPTGEFESALTPNSKLTKILKVAGWSWNEDISQLDTDEFIGKYVKLLVKDYTPKAEGSSPISIIGEVSEYKGEIPKDSASKEIEEPTDDIEVIDVVTEEDPEIKKRRLEYKKMLDDGLITQPAYAKFMQELE